MQVAGWPAVAGGAKRLLVSFHDECVVLSAESERIGQTHINLGRARFVGDVIQIKIGVRFVEVDRRRNQLILHRKNTRDQLNRTGGGDEMPHHRLDRTNGNLGRVVAEDRFDRQRFDRVVFLCAGPVRGNVVNQRSAILIDRVWIDASLIERLSNRRGRSSALIWITSPTKRDGCKWPVGPPWPAGLNAYWYRFTMSVSFCPPNPNELDRHTSTSAGRASLGT